MEMNMGISLEPVMEITEMSTVEGY